MKLASALIIILCCSIIGCNNSSKPFIAKQLIINNKDLENAIIKYYNYIDSVNYQIDNYHEYIYIQAAKSYDTTTFTIFLWGGAYIFCDPIEKEKIFDLVIYKNHYLLLTGDYPNEVINITKNKELNPIDIVKTKYPDQYKKYLKDKLSVGPLIYDYMNMTLIFKKGKLISCKRQYY